MRKIIIGLMSLTVISACAQENKKSSEKSFKDSFGLDSCKLSATGRNEYFILEPGYQLTLEGKEDKKTVRLVITVLNETKKIGDVETRVVEENESENGQTIEISRNFFAFCEQTKSIFYFGEDVDIFKRGKIVNHEGAWIAGEKNKPGLMMPGQPIVGDKYYQEIAPGIAMDRGEIVSTTEKFQAKVGSWENCLKIEETTPLNPKEKEYKMYAPGIGMVKDGSLTLIKFEFLPSQNK